MRVRRHGAGAGLVPISFLIAGYFLSVFILTLNNFRTLGAHRYTNPGGEVSFLAQMLDSVNYPNWPLVSELLMPVGLRFHGLHHVFPSLPYHNLPAAHRRLMAELPADSPYRQTVSPGLLAAVAQLCAQFAKNGPRGGNAPRPPFQRRHASHQRHWPDAHRGMIARGYFSCSFSRI